MDKLICFAVPVALSNEDMAVVDFKSYASKGETN